MMTAGWRERYENNEECVGERTLSDEEFVSKEERLQRDELARYGDDSSRFTTMYYPQSCALFDPTAEALAALEIAPQQPHCALCHSRLDNSTFRRFKGEREYCLVCLRRMGCCIHANSEHFLFPDLVAVIMSYLPEYYHATRAARVSRLWLSCFNFDHNHESDVMALKREWIGRELYFRNHSKALSVAGAWRLLEFQRRFDLGALLGEWMDGKRKSQFRWANLCRLIAESDFYASEYKLEATRRQVPPTFLQTPHGFSMTVPLQNDPSRVNTYTIPSVLAKGGTMQHVIDDADAAFSATVHTTDGNVMSVSFDAATGVLVLPPGEVDNRGAEEEPRKKKSWFRCSLC